MNTSLADIKGASSEPRPFRSTGLMMSVHYRGVGAVIGRVALVTLSICGAVRLVRKAA
jgi:hypothetical protein